MSAFTEFTEKTHTLTASIPSTIESVAGFPRLRGDGALRYGDIHEKFNFSEKQKLRRLRTCQKHFDTILLNFLLDYISVKFKESTQWCKTFHVATPIATTVYYKIVTKNID